MADPVLTRALERREVIRKEAEELDRFIATYQKLAAEATIVAGATVMAAATVKPAPKTGSLGRKPLKAAKPKAKPQGGRQAATGQTPTPVIRSAALALLGTAEKPISSRELLALLQQRDIVILGQNPAGNLAAKLDQAPGHPFKNFSNLGWWRADRAYPPANYYPGQGGTDKEAPDSGKLSGAPNGSGRLPLHS